VKNDSEERQIQRKRVIIIIIIIVVVVATFRNRNRNRNSSHDNVYGAVIMTKVIARVHPVHLMNVDKMSV